MYARSNYFQYNECDLYAAYNDWGYKKLSLATITIYSKQVNPINDDSPVRMRTISVKGLGQFFSHKEGPSLCVGVIFVCSRTTQETCE